MRSSVDKISLQDYRMDSPTRLKTEADILLQVQSSAVSKICLNRRMSSHYDDEDSSQSNTDGEPGGYKMSLRERPRQYQTRQLRKRAEELKFLQDFDPEKSARERRKLMKKPLFAPVPSKNTAYDERGRLREVGLNICDCMDERCIGCFFPCPNCHSCKCGPVCRVNRKFAFETIEFDGKDGVLRNKYLSRH